MYVMEEGLWRWTPKLAGQERADLAKYPAAAVQEPPQGEKADCVFVSFRSPQAIGLNPGGAVTFVALYAAEDITANTELFVHYGKKRRRNYTPGAAAALHQNENEIRTSELPRCWCKYTNVYRSRLVRG